jgi:hypothetical protein
MKNFNICLVILTLLALSSCASRPSSIAASYVSHEKYMDYSCTQLATKMGDARGELQKFSDMQNSKANLDAGTVFFVLIPASKLSGDHEGDVAKWKGEVEAINTAQEKLKCK